MLDYDCAWLTTAAEKAQKADEILNAICSGRYRAIVVADLSNSSQFDDFEATFGTQLQEFVRKGGYLAMASIELMQMCDVVNRLFETTWRGSNYYRTQW